jgi:hypothetical protein
MALLGAIVGIVTTESFGWLRERDRRGYEEEREYRLFQRETMLDIYRRMWALRSESAKLHHDYNEWQAAAKKGNTDAAERAKSNFEGTRDRCIGTSHQLETLIGLVEDEELSRVAEELRTLGVALSTRFDDPSQVEALQTTFHAKYSEFRKSVLPAIKRLYID